MTNCNLFFSSAFNFLYIIKAQATITFVKEWVFTNCVITIENDFWNDRLLSDKFLCVTLSHMSIGSRMVVPKEKFIQWVEEHTKAGGDA